MEFMKELAQSGVLAVLVAFIGLIFTYNNSRSLAKQSEANAIVTSMEKILQEIADENYKFWRDVTERNEEHEAKCRLFQAYVFYRCNLLEDKSAHLNRKCQSWFHDHIDHRGFERKTTKIIGNIRDKSTYNSENPDLVKDKFSRVLFINNETIKLYGVMHELTQSRYATNSETFSV
ncbi:hypothetical protein [Pseudomonas monteilii]|uniref:DUF4760 domain-containing protein n=1 Tax=Pseudomonas monteilii TaxID=76759 RepID=A0A399MDJ3_9PSED|nr:hypothetical protein [Pseudomonas monteilii]RII79139.1 hypothetical protein D0894_06010 [Pseudomonas monteilii]